MKNFYEVGRVYVWQNMTGILGYLNGQETVVTGGIVQGISVSAGGYVPMHLTDTPAPIAQFKFVGARPGDLRPKNPPPGEQTVRDLFKLPQLETI